MEYKSITIDSEIYNKLTKIIESGENELIFRRAGSDDILNIEIRSESNISNIKKEKNIVEKWMDDIQNIISDTTHENYEKLLCIRAYCDAVTTSITS